LKAFIKQSRAKQDSGGVRFYDSGWAECGQPAAAGLQVVEIPFRLVHCAFSPQVLRLDEKPLSDPALVNDPWKT
jgi:hypothetical protein